MGNKIPRMIITVVETVENDYLYNRFMQLVVVNNCQLSFDITTVFSCRIKTF